MLGYHRPASETPFQYGIFTGVLMMARFEWYLDPLSHHHQLKKETKNVVKVRSPLTKLSGSAHGVYYSKYLEYRKQDVQFKNSK